MFNHDRRRRLLKLLAQQRNISNNELCLQLHTSIATVRRDIAWLAEHDLITRWHGGIAVREQVFHAPPRSSDTFHWNLQQQVAQKRAIARRAAMMCIKGETVIITGGSTTFLMTEFLARKKLKILTNSFLAARELINNSNSEVFLQGGTIHREQNVILSPFEQDLSTYYDPVKTFIGVYGIAEQGLLEADPVLVRSEQQIIDQAGKLIVLADSSKFQHSTGTVLCSLNRVATVITDTGAPPDAIDMLKKNGVQVIQVEPDRGVSVRLLVGLNPSA